MEPIAACIHCGTRANAVKHFCSRCGFARVIDPNDFAELRELDGCLCATSDGREREAGVRARRVVSGAVLDAGSCGVELVSASKR